MYTLLSLGSSNGLNPGEITWDDRFTQRLLTVFSLSSFETSSCCFLISQRQPNQSRGGRYNISGTVVITDTPVQNT